MRMKMIPGGEIAEVEESVGIRLYEQGKAVLIPEEAAEIAQEAPDAAREPEAAAEPEAPEAPEAKPARKTRKK